MENLHTKDLQPNTGYNTFEGMPLANNFLADSILLEVISLLRPPIPPRNLAALGYPAYPDQTGNELVKSLCSSRDKFGESLKMSCSEG